MMPLKKRKLTKAGAKILLREVIDKPGKRARDVRFVIPLSPSIGAVISKRKPSKKEKAPARKRLPVQSERLRKLAARVDFARSYIERARRVTIGVYAREFYLRIAARDLADAVEYLAAARWKAVAKKRQAKK
jgi:hypothetical protein